MRQHCRCCCRTQHALHQPNEARALHCRQSTHPHLLPACLPACCTFACPARSRARFERPRDKGKRRFAERMERIKWERKQPGFVAESLGSEWRYCLLLLPAAAGACAARCWHQSAEFAVACPD
jgi:hypothetical protein